MIDIYSALIQQLESATISYITADDIAYDNADFKYEGKDAWISTNFIPVQRATDSKDSVGNVDTGFFQIDVFVPLNDATGSAKRYNLRALEIVNDILVAFADNTQLNFGDAKVRISNADFAAPLISESWYQIPITINYTRI